MRIQVTVSTGNGQPWCRIYHEIFDQPYTEALIAILEKYAEDEKHVRAIEILFPVPR